MSGQAAAGVRALELAYRYLNRRERTTQELRQHLLGRELDVAAVEEAIAELTEAGYLDDARYARIFAQDKRELELWGSARIRRTLLARGIERDVVEAALEDEVPRKEEEVPRKEQEVPRQEHDNCPGEFERALALLRRRFPSPPSDRRERQRALGVLLRRGYEPELAIDTVNAYSNGHA